MTERKKLPELSRLNELFRYENGNLYWKIKPHKKAHRTNFNKPGGTLVGPGYLTVQFDKKNYLVHRLVYKMFTDKEPSYLDHINNNSVDNRFENLQEVTQSINILKGPIRKKNKSGYPGVFFYEPTQKWQAYINMKRIGYFKSKEDAINARKIEETKLLKNYGN